jgi:hypothetical protein
MPSLARQKFGSALLEIAFLCTPGRVHTVDPTQRRLHYHAALAMYVAAWQAYLESVCREFLVDISDPLDIRFSAVRSLLSDKIETELKRFNTPNWENSRNLLIGATGYDPINDWNWPRRSLGGVAFRGLINEILQVRHSFAHGYPMPAYSWNSDSRGRPRLALETMGLVKGALVQVVSTTDRGLSQEISGTYGVGKAWY